MRLVQQANACFSLFYRGKHILMDPWMNAPSVAQGWTPYPPAKSRMQDLQKPDLVYISHIHSDHCEEETMKHIDRDTPILIMDLSPNFLHKMLKARGFENITLMQIGKRIKVDAIDELEAEPFGATFGHICANVIDSSVIFKLDGKVILNCNDNKPSIELCNYIKDQYERIDVAFIPGGGGSGYPAMYENLSASEKKDIVSNNIKNYFKIFSNAVDVLKPKIAIPVAGGYAIRGPYAETVNWLQNRTLDKNEIIDFHNKNGDYKDTKIIPVQPGLEVNVETGDFIKGGYKPWTTDQLKSFFKELADEKIIPKVKTSSLVPGLLSMMKTARINLWRHQQRLGMILDYTIYFEIIDYQKTYELDLSTNELHNIPAGQKKVGRYLSMKLDQDTMLEWLLGYEDFNMLDSGHRIIFNRNPNDYVVEAYYLMSLFRL